MKVITPGHKYELANLDNPDQPGQVIQFIEMKQKPPVYGTTFEFVTVHDGTTNEEVLAVLIDRLNAMQAKLPCRENAIATTHIETARLWLNKRTAERKARGVEGTPKP